MTAMRLALTCLVSLAAGLGAPLGASAADARPAKAAPTLRDCFRKSDISNWVSAGRGVVNLRVDIGDYYQVKLMTDCDNIDLRESIGFDSRGSSLICSGLDLIVVAPGPIGAQRCPAQSLRRLTPAEVAALPAGQRP